MQAPPIGIPNPFFRNLLVSLEGDVYSRAYVLTLNVPYMCRGMVDLYIHFPHRQTTSAVHEWQSYVSNHNSLDDVPVRSDTLQLPSTSETVAASN